MRISVFVALVVVVATTSWCSNAVAQSASVEHSTSGAQTAIDSQQSTMMFDINFTKLKSSKLATTLGIDAQLEKVTQSDAGKPDPGKLVRVVGAMSMPESVAEAQTISSGKMPMNLYVRMQFEDKEAADKMMAKAEAGTSGKVERDGKTFYRPKDDGKAPENVLTHRVDPTTVEIATESYAFLANRDVLSQGLQDAWALTGDDSIRLAIDVEAASGFISDAVEMGKARVKGSPQEAQVVGFLGLIDNMKNLRVGLDFSNANMLTLQATGVDESEAKELEGGLDALLGLGKLMGGLQLQGLQQQDPQAGAVVSQILDALDASREGNEVSVAIPHPEGLEALAEKFAPMLGVGGARPTAPAQPSGLVPVP